MTFEYIKEYYQVPADIGRRVIVDGKHGTIIKDMGNYIGVNFDSDKAGIASACHPTWEVTYGEMGKIRKPSRSAARYQRYLASDGIYENFKQFLAWDDYHQKHGH
jgi:hypothetical protein